MRTLFSFPDPVNETSARVVAAGVVLEAVLFLVFREGWLLVLLMVDSVTEAAGSAQAAVQRRARARIRFRIGWVTERV